MAHAQATTDETATAYAKSLGKNMHVEHIVRMIRLDKLRGYEQGGGWYIDNTRQINDPERASRLIGAGVGLCIGGLILLGMAPTVLFSTWGIFASLNASEGTMRAAASAAHALIGLVGAAGIVLSVVAHMNVRMHRDAETKRWAATGRAIGKLGRTTSQVALVLFGFGLFLLLRSVAELGTLLHFLGPKAINDVLDPVSAIVCVASAITLLVATSNA